MPAISILTLPKIREWVWELESRFNSWGRRLDQSGDVGRIRKFKKFLDGQWSKFHADVVFGSGNAQELAEGLVAQENLAHDAGFPIALRVVELHTYDIENSRPDFVELDKPATTWRVPQYVSAGGNMTNSYGLSLELEPGTGYCALRATTCVDGTCREKVVDLTPIVEALERRASEWHRRKHDSEVVSGGDDDELVRRIVNTARGIGQDAAIRALYGGLLPLATAALPVPPGYHLALRANEVAARARAGDGAARAEVARTAAEAEAGDPTAAEALATIRKLDEVQRDKAASLWRRGTGSDGARSRRYGFLTVGHLPFEIIGDGRPVVTSTPRGSGSAPKARQTLDYRRSPSGGGRLRDYRASTPAIKNTQVLMDYGLGSGLIQTNPGRGNLPNYTWTNIPLDDRRLVPVNQATVREYNPPPRFPALPPGVSVPPGSYPVPPYLDPYGQYAGPYPGYIGPGSDPYGGFTDPYGAYDPGVEPITQDSQKVWDPDTGMFYGSQAEQEYDPDTDSFGPVFNYNPYAEDQYPEWPVWPDPYGLDPQVMGWFTRLRGKTAAGRLYRKGAAA